jgi:hypothetical protein
MHAITRCPSCAHGRTWPQSLAASRLVTSAASGAHTRRRQPRDPATVKAPERAPHRCRGIAGQQQYRLLSAPDLVALLCFLAFLDRLQAPRRATGARGCHARPFVTRAYASIDVAIYGQRGGRGDKGQPTDKRAGKIANDKRCDIDISRKQ